MSMKNGKKPVSQKPKLVTLDTLFGSSDIPADIKADMAEKGWKPRWLSARILNTHNWHHPKDWKVYKRPNASTGDFKLGNDPDGVVRKGDLILGYKDKESLALHKQALQNAVKIQNRAKESQAAELRRHARNIGLETEISEGYDYDKGEGNDE